jgi:hypothetical protein
MKRLRYILWAFVLNLELELHPLNCPHEWHAGLTYEEEECELPEGHFGLHRNTKGIQWR